MKANLMAREIFSEQSQPEYVPHLSLIYGDFPENIENELTSRLSDFNLEFETKNLGLYKLIGEPEAWEKIVEIPLGKNNE